MPNPIALVLTGSSICTSVTGTGSITSSTSVSGVSYQLKNSGGTNVGSAQSGTGSGLTWSNVAAGTGYYAVATGSAPTSCTSTSNAVAVVEVPNPEIVCPNPGSTTVLCEATIAVAQESTDTEFSEWLGTFENPNGYGVAISYVYDPNTNTVQSDNGYGPKNPISGTTAKVTVTWTLTNSETGCTNSCSQIFTVDNACKIDCSAVPTPVICEGTETGTITVTAGGGATTYSVYLYKEGSISPDYSKTGIIDNPFSVTFENLAAGNYTYAVRDANYATTNDACGELVVIEPGTPCDDALCTYTQGAYGNSGGKYCDGNNGGISTRQLITNAIDNSDGVSDAKGTITVGKTGRSVLMSLTEAPDCIISRLPGGGAATELPNFFGNQSICSASIPLKKGKINNVLLSQTITLALNINIKGTTDLADFKLQVGTLATALPEGGCGSNEPKQRVCAHYDENCNWILTVNEYTYRTFGTTVIAASGGSNSSVAGLLDLANRALANTDGKIGKEDGATLSDISNAVASINEIFDECRIPMGWDKQLCNNVPTGGCTVPTPIVAVSNYKTRSGVAKSVNASSISLIKAYPNPFKDHITFEMRSDVSADASLQVFNILGQKVFDVFNGRLEAGTTKVVEFNSHYSGNQTTLIYVYKLGENTHTGKLIMEK